MNWTSVSMPNAGTKFKLWCRSSSALNLGAGYADGSCGRLGKGEYQGDGVDDAVAASSGYKRSVMLQ